MLSFYVLRTAHCPMGMWSSEQAPVISTYRNIASVEPTATVLRITADGIYDITPRG
jgi:hypothetical protein